MAKASDSAWDTVFQKTNALKKISRDGYFFISADDLKRLTGGQEPRLLAKHDTLDKRPKPFVDHEIAIFPVKNGEYILFHDPEEKSFYKFSDHDLDLPVLTYHSQVDLYKFDSYPPDRKLSESQAIDFAFISSLLRTIVKDKKLNLAIRGKLHSGKFDFLLPTSKYQVNVSGVQIEVDAGYESDDSIYLIEAKVGRRKDFHIRQLYYPYLEWSHRSKKRIVPIFFVYTNSQFYFHEFAFSEEFGQLQINRSFCYSINESPIANFNLPSLFKSVKVEKEPNIPFPQANDLDKVVDVISLVATGIANKEDISESFDFDERQGDYYGNAACYLGFMKKEKGEFVLTEVGKTFLETKSSSERTIFIVEQLLKRPAFRNLIQKLIDTDSKLELISNDEISAIIERNTILTKGTPQRRASTVRSWLRWLLKNWNIT